jgi:hypothetical protein
MLKFILLVIVFLLVVRMALRLLKRGLFFLYKDTARRAGHSQGSFSSGKQMEEGEYEVIESHLHDKDRDIE